MQIEKSGVKKYFSMGHGPFWFDRLFKFGPSVIDLLVDVVGKALTESTELHSFSLQV